MDDLKSLCKEKGVDWQLAYRDLLEFRPCTILHPHLSCAGHFWSFLYDGVKRAIPMYAPIHIVTTVIVLLARLTSTIKKKAELYRSISQEYLNRLTMSENSEQTTEQMSWGDILKQVVNFFSYERMKKFIVSTARISFKVLINIFRSSLFLAAYCARMLQPNSSLHSRPLMMPIN